MKKLHKECKALWREAVIKKWGFYCEFCGAPAQDAHHFIVKSRCNNLRYDVLNGVPLCRNHHFVIHGNTHDTLTRRDIEDKIIKGRGRKWINYIRKNAPKKVKVNKQWLEKTIKQLQ